MGIFNVYIETTITGVITGVEAPDADNAAKQIRDLRDSGEFPEIGWQPYIELDDFIVIEVVSEDE